MLRSGQAMEKVSLKGLELSLLASGDGTEVIHHRLAPGRRWAMSPEPGWEGLEVLLILSGTLIWKHDDGPVALGAGDCLQFCPVEHEQWFVAETEVEFNYVASRPVFHHYCRDATEFRDLAVSVEEKDGYTADHCDRITTFALRTGEVLNLSHNESVILSLGAFFHDIGKVKVPDSILGKPGALTAEEWQFMKLHPVFGSSMLEATGLPRLVSAARVVEQHHERWDGKGYPQGLAGTDIMIEATIVAVVDAYDAMTTDRPYHKALTREQAIAELIRGKGTQFRPDVVDAFLQILPELDDAKELKQ